MYTKEKKNEIGRRIRELRNKKGLSIGRLCEIAGFTSTKTLTKFESGSNVPDGENLDSLAKALGVSKEMILTGPEPEPAAAVGEPEAEGQEQETASAAPGVYKITPENRKKIKSLREAAGHGQKYVADICRVSKFIVCSWENGRIKSMTLANAEALSKLYGVPVEQIAGGGRKIQTLCPNGDAIKNLREKAGVKREEIAELCGMSRNTVASWERGMRGIPMECAQTLAELFDVPLDEIAKEKPERQPADPVKAEAVPGPSEEDRAGSAPEDASEEAAEKAESAAKMEDDMDKEKNKIPENPEERFSRNILYYASEKGIQDDEFEKEVGCPLDFFNDVLRHNYKIPLGVVLKAARYFGKSVEEVSCDDTAEQIKQQILEMEKKIRELKKKIGA